MTPTIVHMHIFKNAGTTLDAVFKPYFGDSFVSFDLEKPGARIGLQQLQSLLGERDDMRYLTSHQVGFPLPSLPDRPIFPIFMLRDPFERVPSSFYFERDVQKRLDPEMTLEAYVRRHLNSPFVTATLGLQSFTLSDARFNPTARRDYLQGEGFHQAMRNLQSTAVFGLVERFDDSIILLTRFFERYFPGISDLAVQGSERMNAGPGPDAARQDAREYLRDNLMHGTFGRLAAALRHETRMLNIARRAFDARWKLYAEQ